ncbi:MAG: hypothetical protein SAMD01599839_21410 [Rectinema sp.]
MSLLSFHAVSMGVAFFAMMSAIVIARYFKTKKWWLKSHRTLNIIAVIFAIAGLVFALLMVSSTGGPHIRVPHAVLGIVTLILLIAMPGLGCAEAPVCAILRHARKKYNIIFHSQYQ